MAKKKAVVEEITELGYCSDCGCDLAVSEAITQKGQLLQYCDNCKDKPENKLQPDRCAACGFTIPGVINVQDGKNYCTPCAEKIDPPMVRPKEIIEELELPGMPAEELEREKEFIASIEKCTGKKIEELDGTHYIAKSDSVMAATVERAESHSHRTTTAERA